MVPSLATATDATKAQANNSRIGGSVSAMARQCQPRQKALSTYHKKNNLKVVWQKPVTLPRPAVVEVWENKIGLWVVTVSDGRIICLLAIGNTGERGAAADGLRGI